MRLADAGPLRSPSLLQSDWWARIKERGGWSSARIAGALVLTRQLGPVRLSYLPHAWSELPADGTPSDDIRTGVAPTGERFANLAANLDEIARATDATLVRWDAPWGADELEPRDAAAAGLSRSPIRVQPPDTVMIDLTADEDALLAAMKSKTRYNIRLSAKRGVEVARLTGAAALQALPTWYDLYRQTAVRDRIAIHPCEYYAAILGGDDASAAGDARAGGDADRDAPTRELLLASYEGREIAGIVTASWAGTSTYLYGASGDEARSVMAPYLLQWTAMAAARERGDRWYDMFGVPPTDDPTHPMHGLWRFKTGFGGTILHRAGAWDRPRRVALAALYRSAERARQWYFHSWKKRGRHAGA